MINFPRKHIADSVVERIIKVQRQQASYEQSQALMQQGMPSSQGTAQQGADIDAAVRTEMPAMAAPAGIEDGIVGRSLDL